MCRASLGGKTVDKDAEAQSSYQARDATGVRVVGSMTKQTLEPSQMVSKEDPFQKSCIATTSQVH